jgi:hypothetical protein
MKTKFKLTEQEKMLQIRGRPGVAFGFNSIVTVPMSGSSLKARIQGDYIEMEISFSYGLENKEVSTYINDISSIEIVEGRLWWLLLIGIPLMSLWFIGIIFIIAFFIIKKRWMILYTPSLPFIIFFEEEYIPNVLAFRDAIMRYKSGKSLIHRPPALPPPPKKIPLDKKEDESSQD